MYTTRWSSRRRLRRHVKTRILRREVYTTTQRFFGEHKIRRALCRGNSGVKYRTPIKLPSRPMGAMTHEDRKTGPAAHAGRTTDEPGGGPHRDGSMKGSPSAATQHRHRQADACKRSRGTWRMVCGGHTTLNEAGRAERETELIDSHMLYLGGAPERESQDGRLPHVGGAGSRPGDHCPRTHLWDTPP